MTGQCSTRILRLPLILLVALVLAPPLAPALLADDWPQWRGADQTMVSSGNGIFAKQG